jgi:tRNA U34 2-thiouridine synthase MnmA/TrmU
VGQHEGVHQWTLGQRAKIMRGHEAYVVVAKDAASAQIHVAADMDHPALYAENFVTGEPHWISGGAPPELSSRSRNA